jgi:succinate-semialdehyde dehydrogenase/glutarate-semialdehyde dehydrogenase
MTQLAASLPMSARRLVEAVVSAQSGAPGSDTFDVTDPATGDVIAGLMDAGPAHGERAVDAAAEMFPAWAATAPRARSEILRRTYDLMISNSEGLAALMTWENGKALPDAEAEVAYAAEFFRWFAEEAVRTDGQYGQAPNGASRTIVTQHPIGVAALVTPWNFPAAMATRKIAPALAAGCTVVLKPAAETPLTALAIAHLMRDAGLPDGVVNIVPTTRPGQVVDSWLADARVRKLSFTGSTNVGKALLSRSADRVLSTSMELGGNAPFVVARDADIRVAVREAMVAKFRNGGQACTAANRFFVHSDVYEQFATAFEDAVVGLRLGHGLHPRTQIGPLVSTRAVAGVQEWVERAVHSGGHVSVRASLPDLPGAFFAPTVIRDVPADAAVLQEEIFGPVAPIVRWSEDDELLAAVNGSDLGLAAYVFSGDLAWALRTAERMDAGMVGVNRGVVSDPSAPFGGMKQSGIGREGAREGLRAFTETQYLSVAWPANA